jgi:fatty acid synthase, animal type
MFSKLDLLTGDGDQVVILRRLGLSDVPSWVSKPPLATILGIGTNNDGYTRESITFPSGPAQAFLARQVTFLVL